MSNYESKYFDIAYYAERSIEDEIDRAGQADIPLFIGAYVTIFIYLSLALGSYTTIRYFLFEVRFTLGLIGLFIVASSAFAALGLFGYLKLKSNLIVAEVVPFLLLSIGADNIFIFVLQYKRLEKHLLKEKLEIPPVEEMIGRVLQHSALSMVMCSVSECVLLFYGGVTVKMPAVVTYSFSAGTAVAFNFILQMTAFPAVLCLDQKRIRSRRADLLCCLQVDKPVEERTKKSEQKLTLPIDDFFENYWYPLISNKFVRPSVIIGFITVTCASIAVCFNFTRVGLDQDLSVPEVSYVRTFFEFQEEYLLVGAPVYFVIAGNLSYEKSEIQTTICSRAGCQPGSLGEMISLAAEAPDYWKIETSSQSWLDDFIDWTDPGTLTVPPSCCNCKGTCNAFEDFEPCMPNIPHPNGELPKRCHRCILPRQERNFYKYLDWFLRDNPGTVCSKSGHAAYAHSVHFVDELKTEIDASSFMTYQSVCIGEGSKKNFEKQNYRNFFRNFSLTPSPPIKSEECTENTQKARILANQITDMLHEKIPSDLIDDDVYVFPYTVYTPYYEMYDNMGEEGSITIALCFIPVFIVTTIMLGFNFLGGAIVTMTILMIILNTAAICVLWDVQFNPLSIINFITGIGISIEFTGHFMSQYLADTGETRNDRVRNTVRSIGFGLDIFWAEKNFQKFFFQNYNNPSPTGSAVFAGVTMTNLPGMIVLKFATAKIIEVFFFRMGLTITLVGMVHGLIFLPVLLTYIGPRRNPALYKSLLKDEEKFVERIRENKTVRENARGTENSGVEGNEAFEREE